MRTKTPAILFALALLISVTLAGAAEAMEVQLRTGKVAATKTVTQHTFVKAVDDRGGEFWVATDKLEAPLGSRLAVLQGGHYTNISCRGLGNEVATDFYTALLIRLDGEHIKGLTTPKLPGGCAKAKK